MHFKVFRNYDKTVQVKSLVQYLLKQKIYINKSEAFIFLLS